MSVTNVDDGEAAYRTLEEPAQAELVVERSRFIAYAAPIRAVADAEALVSALRREHYDARHVCFGLRVGRGAQGVDRSNDDGEPAKTGGYPLWQLLEGDDVTDAVVAVVRYFGGVKLGTGGLARAYREAGRHALDAARIVERWPESVLELDVGYDQVDRINYLLSPLQAVRVVDTQYAGSVIYRLAVRKVAVSDLAAQLGGLLQRDPASVFTPAEYV